MCIRDRLYVGFLGDDCFMKRFEYDYRISDLQDEIAKYETVSYTHLSDVFPACMRGFFYYFKDSFLGTVRCFLGTFMAVSYTHLWMKQHHDKDCYPPTIINITDGEYNGASHEIGRAHV